MKKLKNIMLVALFMLLLGVSFNVKAESIDYYLSNSTQNYEYVNKDNNKAIDVKRGDYIYVTTMFDHKDLLEYFMLDGGKLTIRWDEKYFSLEEVDGKYYSLVNSDLKNLKVGSVSKYSNRVVLNDLSDRTHYLNEGKLKVVEFKFRVLESAPSGVAKIYQMDGEDTLECEGVTGAGGVNSQPTIFKCSTSLYSELKYNVIKSTVNKLSMIKIEGQELEYFSEDNNDYDIEVDSKTEKIKIEVTKKDSHSVISGDTGEKKVSYGLNKFQVHVISESGVKNTYNINVTREDLRSSDNTLKTLTVSEGELDFKSSVKDYTINVGNAIEKITITSSLNDSKAKYVTDYRNKEIELIEGSNKVEIKVVSEKGEERVYTLNINRALSSNNSLKSLKVNDTKIDLVENEFIYSVEVENDVDEVVIKAVPNDSKATVNLDEKYPLVEGENEINIKVVAAGGQEAMYTLNVTRKKIPSKDSLLTSIKIEGYDIGFKPTVTTYDLKIKDSDDTLDITTTQEDPNASVEIEGNKDLENGSIIKINVQAEDGSYTRYFIRIEKGSSGISPVIIIILVLLLLLGICVGLIIYRKKKAENKEFDKLDDEPKEEVVNEVNNTTEDYVGQHEIEDKEKDV